MKLSVTVADLAVAIAEAAREDARPGEDPDALAAATLMYALTEGVARRLS